VRIATVLGTRPDFIKAAPVSRELSQISAVQEIIIHTGQHYDADLSERIWREVGLPTPHFCPGTGSGPPGQQTGRMLEAVEAVLRECKPDKVVVHGDTNSTLAGALAAVKLHIPVAHVEAGVRSGDRAMAEEVNRILVDHLATWLFITHPAAAEPLRREGIAESAITCIGDVTLDAIRLLSPLAPEERLRTFDLTAGQYVLATFHRAENTGDPLCLRNIVGALADLAATCPVIVPLHPRTLSALERAGLASSPVPRLRWLGPQGYLDMLALERFARLIVTDSGTVQREAYFHRIPSVIMRPVTEWPELVESGWARLLPPSGGAALAAGLRVALSAPSPQAANSAIFGDGTAARRLAQHLADSECQGSQLA
jgi:UDP-GlcNAc3NAcA epimerase